MNRRIRKKWHRRVVQDLMIDLSQDSFWRRRVLDAPPGLEFAVDAQNLDHVPAYLARLVRRLRLEFDVAAAPPREAEPWLTTGGLVLFRFRAREFPTVVAYSGNNPMST